MARRIRYVIGYLGKDRADVAKFSCLRDALLFAIARSEEQPTHLIEVRAPDGLAGQYQDGKPTPEFEQHHISGTVRIYVDSPY